MRLDLALGAACVDEETVLLEVSAHPQLVATLGLGGHEAVVGTLHDDTYGGAPSTNQIFITTSPHQSPQ